MSFRGRQYIRNIITATDSYKQSHWRMYPPEMTHMTSYLEARVGGEYEEAMFFGLQYIMNQHLEGEVVTVGGLEDAKDLAKRHFGRKGILHEAGWWHIIEDHQGTLPVMIRAVPEGTVVPTGNVLMTIENTCPECAWVVNYLETLLVQVWYPCTVATISLYQKGALKVGLERTAESLDKLPFMLHDFGYRGSTSDESAGIGGAAHLVNFQGTDTLAALELLDEHYQDDAVPVGGYSIPAAEHSTICAWGQSREVDAYRNILQEFNTGLVAVVSDSYDVFNACRELWGKELYHYVWTGKNTGRTLVIRPDSGDPRTVVPDVLDILGDAFGYTVNEKGYKMLPEYVRVIQGDGITRHSLPGLIQAIRTREWSLENMAFGSGGGLLQDCNRDTLRFAMKCSAVKYEGEHYWRGVSKAPVTDTWKVSKHGYLYLTTDGKGDYTTTAAPTVSDVLRPVFRDGAVLRRQGLGEIRARAEAALA